MARSGAVLLLADLGSESGVCVLEGSRVHIDILVPVGRVSDSGSTLDYGRTPWEATATERTGKFRYSVVRPAPPLLSLHTDSLFEYHQNQVVGRRLAELARANPLMRLPHLAFFGLLLPLSMVLAFDAPADGTS